jgi:hypothetical protein
MTPPRRRAMPVLEFVADALFGIGCMIIGLGGLCTLSTLTLGHAGPSTLAAWRPLAATLVVGGPVILLGRALRRFARTRIRRVDDE